MIPSTFVYINTNTLRHILQVIYTSSRTNLDHLTFQRNLSTTLQWIILYKNYLSSYMASGLRHTAVL